MKGQRTWVVQVNGVVRGTFALDEDEYGVMAIAKELKNVLGFPAPNLGVQDADGKLQLVQSEADVFRLCGANDFAVIEPVMDPITEDGSDSEDVVHDFVHVKSDQDDDADGDSSSDTNDSEAEDEEEDAAGPSVAATLAKFENVFASQADLAAFLALIKAKKGRAQYMHVDKTTKPMESARAFECEAALNEQLSDEELSLVIAFVGLKPRRIFAAGLPKLAARVKSVRKLRFGRPCGMREGRHGPGRRHGPGHHGPGHHGPGHHGPGHHGPGHHGPGHHGPGHHGPGHHGPGHHGPGHHGPGHHGPGHHGPGHHGPGHHGPGHHGPWHHHGHHGPPHHGPGHRGFGHHGLHGHHGPPHHAPWHPDAPYHAFAVEHNETAFGEGPEHRPWRGRGGCRGGGRGGRGRGGCGGRGWRARGKGGLCKNKQMARLVMHANVEDETKFNAGDTFIKTWLVRNDAQEAWPGASAVVHVGGDKLHSAESRSFVVPPLAPGEQCEVSIGPLAAPGQPGLYKSFFRLQTVDEPEVRFGQRLWCSIFSEPGDGAADASASAAAEPAKASS